MKCAYTLAYLLFTIFLVSTLNLSFADNAQDSSKMIDEIEQITDSKVNESSSTKFIDSSKKEWELYRLVTEKEANQKNVLLSLNITRAIESVRGLMLTKGKGQADDTEVLQSSTKLGGNISVLDNLITLSIEARSGADYSVPYNQISGGPNQGYDFNIRHFYLSIKPIDGAERFSRVTYNSTRNYRI